MLKKSFSFEDAYPIIKTELDKRAYLFQLHAIPSLSYEDFCQDFLKHLYVKWKLYDSSRPLIPFVVTVFNNQWANWLRNKMRCQLVCVRCPLYHNSDGSCGWTKSGFPNDTCVFFKRWQDTKQQQNWQVNMPVSEANHLQEVYSIPSDNLDYDATKKNLEIELRKVLLPFQYRIYTILFKKNKSEKEALFILGYKSLKKKKEGEKVIRETKKIIIEKSKLLIKEDKVDFV